MGKGYHRVHRGDRGTSDADEDDARGLYREHGVVHSAGKPGSYDACGPERYLV